MDDVVNAANHKNPQVRSESIHWLTRFLKTCKKAPTKAEIKTLAECLLKVIEFPTQLSSYQFFTFSPYIPFF